MTTRARLLSLETFGIKLGLESMRTILAELGNPERAWPAVHVAGTNGKGSTCAMVACALRAAGHVTGLYTSPHLDRLEERVAVDGRPVEARAFDDAAADVLTAVDRARAHGRLAAMPTFFEATTAVAFELFRRAEVGVAVIEVGLGGRFDATNVVTPIVGAITSIAFDHERHLGTTIDAIAGEKAGIAKAGVPLVVGDMPEAARTVIERAAATAGAPIVDAASLVDGGLAVDRGRATVRLRTPETTYPAVRLALAGRHQVGNAAVAVRVLEIASDRGVRVDRDAVVAGLRDARWPARLEWLQTASGPLLIDAAHNPAGALALASYLQDAGAAPLPMAVAAMRDKDLDGMVSALAPVVSRFVATEVEYARSYEAGGLARELHRIAPHIPVVVEPDPMHAIEAALADGGTAVAAGSIYFVGPLRARLIASGARSI